MRVAGPPAAPLSFQSRLTWLVVTIGSEVSPAPCIWAAQVGSLGVSVLLLMTSWHIAIHAYDKLQHSISLGAFGSVASWTGTIPLHATTP